MSRNNRRAFALYEVLIGLAIFSLGVIALGRSVQNCLNASGLSAQENRVRQLLANRMAEIQAAPGFPDSKKETKIATGYGEVVIIQQAVPAGLKGEFNTELSGINRITLIAEWKRGGIQQKRQLQFYIFRHG